MRKNWMLMFCVLTVCGFLAAPASSAAQGEPSAAIVTSESTAMVESILLDEWQPYSLDDSVEYTVTRESPDMPEEMRQEILTAKEDYREAWIQLRYPVENAQRPIDQVEIETYSSQVVLLWQEPVNWGDGIDGGCVRDSIRVAVRKELTPEEALAAFAACGPAVEIRDDSGQVLARLPLCFEEADTALARAAAQGFHMRITHGCTRADTTGMETSFLPPDIQLDVERHPEHYFFFDLLGAKWKDTENPVLGLRFRVENRQDVWAVPMNDDLYGGSQIGPTGNWDNLLEVGPAFASVTLVYRKPDGVEYLHQAYDDLQGLQIGAYFSPVGYGSLGKIDQNTIYGPKVKTLVDLSHWLK